MRQVHEGREMFLMQETWTQCSKLPLFYLLWDIIPLIDFLSPPSDQNYSDPSRALQEPIYTYPQVCPR